MNDLERHDYVLIELAKKAAQLASEQGSQTSGAALRCGSGNVYTGVDICGDHGAHAEVVALGTAKASGETRFECLVVVGGNALDRIITPCGHCRQLLLEHCHGLEVIVHIEEHGAKKATTKELLPY